MIKINLLPIGEIKQKLQRRREFFLLIGSLLLLAGLLGGATLVLQAKVDGIKGEVQVLEKRKASYAAIQKEIDQIKSKQAELEVKIETIKRLRSDSQLTVRVIDELGKLVPNERLWLNSLRISDSTMTMAGVGLDNPTIADYMEELEDSPYFANIDLANSSHSDMGGQKLKTFSLTLRISPPAPPEPEQETGAQP